MTKIIRFNDYETQCVSDYKAQLYDNNKRCVVKFFTFGEECKAFQEAFRLCILHHGPHGPENAEWLISGGLLPHQARDPYGRCGIIEWKQKG